MRDHLTSSLFGCLDHSRPLPCPLHAERPGAPARPGDDGSGIVAPRVSAAGIGWRAHWLRQQVHTRDERIVFLVLFNTRDERVRAAHVWGTGRRDMDLGA